MENIKSQLKTITNLDKSTWNVVRFGDVAIQQKESVDRENTDLTRYVAGNHMQTNDLHIRQWGEFDGSYVGPAFHRKFEKGDILYGSRRTYLRKVAVAEFDGITANTTYVMKANKELIEPALLPFVLLSENFAQHSIQNSKGSTNPYINWKDIDWYEFRLPSRDMQKKIAKLLWAVDEMEENVIDAIKKLEVSLQSIFLNDYQNLSSKEMTLSQIAYINPLAPKDIANFKGSVNFIPMEAVSEDGELTLGQMKDFQENKAALTFFQNGDILFAKITPCMENGKGGIVQGLKYNIGIGSTEFHVLRPKKDSDLFYIYYLTKMPFFRKMAERYMTGSAGQKRVPTSFLEKLKIQLPSEIDREKLGNECYKIWMEKKRLEQFFELTRRLRQSLINSIF